jgi:glycosyltransferase involved in cell wall biosynthesis
MKVLMIPSWYPTPGAPLLGTFYKEQAEALAARGIEMAVTHVSVGSEIGHHNGIRRAVVNGVLTYTYTRPNFTPRWEHGRRLQRTRMLEALYRRIEQEWGTPDVVNLRSSLHGYEAISLCRKHGLPLFFMEHSSYVMTEGTDSPALKRLRAVMEFASVNACVSNALRDVMQSFGETRVIPDPVDGGFFAPEAVPAADRNEFMFRAMGQLRPIKGYDALIRAFALLKERTDKPVRLEIAGSGALKESLQSLIDTHSLNDSCSLIGSVPRENAADFMNGCDCFICSSRVETLSCVLNEAAACGKPVISTRCGGPLDIVTEETGLLVPVDDADSMAAAMLTMMETAQKYDGARIRELTLNRFGRDVVCDLLIDACRSAAKGRER